MEEVLHHHHHHHHPYQDINGRLGKNNLISSSMASMASLAAAVGSTAPPPPPSTVGAPSSSNVSVTLSGQQPSHLCAGCGHSIKDRYLLQALDSYWHEDCLKCSCCGCRLGEVGSNLFTKANLILCKRDYLRLFGATGSCAACCKPIPAFEMVMRAKSNVYHLDCFACQQCHQRFCVGDRFYLCDNQILCEYDYEERLIFANLAGSSHPAQFNSRGAPPPPPPPPQPPASQSHPSQQSALTENGNGPYGRNGEASGGDVVRSQQQRVWNGPSLSPPSTSAEPAVPESSTLPPPPPAAPVAAVKQQQDSPGAVEHDASSSGYGSPDSGGLIDEG